MHLPPHGLGDAHGDRVKPMSGRRVQEIEVHFGLDSVTFEIFEGRVFGMPDARRTESIQYSKIEALPTKQFSDFTDSNSVFIIPNSGRVVGFLWESTFEGSNQGFDYNCRGPYLIEGYPVEALFQEMKRTIYGLLNTIRELEEFKHNTLSTATTIGHNNPPSDLDELKADVEEILEEVQKNTIELHVWKNKSEALSRHSRAFTEIIMHGIADGVGKGIGAALLVWLIKALGLIDVLVHLIAR